ncbi:hypothetical protein OH77DRAFT_1525755 [Trametes cingulata]|nr:hypothetical protein OH77DRAFT_1525755 [Trametes cingulata]
MPAISADNTSKKKEDSAPLGTGLNPKPQVATPGSAMPPTAAAEVGGVLSGVQKSTPNPGLPATVARGVPGAVGVSTDAGEKSNPARNLAAKVEDVRADAMQEQDYLGSGRAFGDVVKWFRDGRCNRVVWASDADTVVQDRARYATDPESVPIPEAPPAVSFTVIGTVAETNFFMRSDGLYRGSQTGGFERKFSGTTLTCALTAPPREYAGAFADFKTATASLETIMRLKKPSSDKDTAASTNARVAQAGTTIQGATFEALKTKHIRLRHAIFAERPPVAGDEEDGSADEDVTSGLDMNDPKQREFNIAYWPLHNNEMAKRALEDIKSTHVAVPLRAYGVDSRIIPPSRYHIDLRGATVLVAFTMLHYNISTPNSSALKDTFCFDISYLRILVPGTTSTTSAVKRHLFMVDPRATTKKPRVL